MIRILKHGATESEKTEADRKVRQTVEAILEDIASRGDAAVRELSARFDKWEPPAFRLRPDEIQSLIDSLPDQVITDITFAQAQIRRFADMEVFVLGHHHNDWGGFCSQRRWPSCKKMRQRPRLTLAIPRACGSKPSTNWPWHIRNP